MKTMMKLAVALFALAVCTPQDLFAQDTKRIRTAPATSFVQADEGTQTKAMIIQEPGYDEGVETYVAPPQPPVRLGFNGQIICEGMRVVSVNYGGYAQQIGLESGDIITHINGQKIRSLYQYQSLLRFAVEQNHGHVDLRIKNVRANWDPYAPRFVRRHLDLPHNDYTPVYPAASNPTTIAGL